MLPWRKCSPVFWFVFLDVGFCVQVDTNLVLVDSTCQNLRRLALAVASHKAVLLEGPIGCGKTALVEFMAAVTGHTKAADILKVQLGDQTDSKVREKRPAFVFSPGLKL